MAARKLDYIERLRRQDPTFDRITLFCDQLTDAHLSQLIDCLLLYPNVVSTVDLASNRLTDETGVKLARCIAASSTITILNIYGNKFGDATYLALAAALRVNASLQYLDMDGNQAEDKKRIEAAFIDTLRLNRGTMSCSYLGLYKYANELSRLKKEAKKQGHPTLQMILNNHLELVSIRSIRR